MKNLYITALAVFISGMVSSQITLTSSTHVPSFGIDFSYSQVMSPPFNAGTIGANQSWDFIGGTPILNSVSYGAAIDGSIGNTITNATLLETESSGAENYYSSSSTDFSLVASHIPSIATVENTDVRELLKFPLTYGDTYNETFAATVDNIISNQSFDRSGSIEITADGYGDLNLPYGTVENVLRVRNVTTYSDTYLDIEIFSYIDTIYTYFIADSDKFIASYTINFSNGIQTIAMAMYQNDLAVTTSVEEQSFEGFDMFPNPATKNVQLNNLASQSIVQLFDLQGKMLLEEQEVNSKMIIDVSKYSPGMYLVKSKHEKQYHTEKLIIE